MQKVITANLNGNAYQVEEQGYEQLVAYLARAEATLEGNPDKSEIIADLEQAIAEKCQRFLRPDKTVVTSREIEQILTEMGPVESSTAASSEQASGEQEKTDEEKKAGPGAARRLYQIREGAMLSGVCNGLAAYLKLDVTLVRVAFVILAVLTKGVWILVYAAMSFIIPYAKTSEDLSAAYGRPFTAKELIEQAKQAADPRNLKEWKRHLRRQRRQWRQQMRGIKWEHQWAPREVPENVAYAAQVWGGLTGPMFGLVNVVLALLLAFALISVVSSNAVFGYPLPPGVPVWAWILGVLFVYQLVASPFKFARRGAYPYGPPYAAVFAPFIGLLWMAVVAWTVWWGYNHLPAVHDFIQRIPEVWDRIVQANK